MHWDHEPNEWSAELLFGTMAARRTQNTVPNWSSALRFKESVQGGRICGGLIEVLLARAVSTPPASTGAASEVDPRWKQPGCANRFRRETGYARAARRSRPPVEFEIFPG